MKDFTAAVQGLPAELYQQIYNETFTADAVQLDFLKYHAPLNLLHVDHASRALFASRSFSTTEFFESLLECREWMIKLPPHLIYHLSEVRILYSTHREFNKDFKNRPRVPSRQILSDRAIRIIAHSIWMQLRQWYDLGLRLSSGSISHIHFRVEIPENWIGPHRVVLDANGSGVTFRFSHATAED